MKSVITWLSTNLRWLWCLQRLYCNLLILANCSGWFSTKKRLRLRTSTKISLTASTRDNDFLHKSNTTNLMQQWLSLRKRKIFCIVQTSPYVSYMGVVEAHTLTPPLPAISRAHSFSSLVKILVAGLLKSSQYITHVVVSVMLIALSSQHAHAISYNSSFRINIKTITIYQIIKQIVEWSEGAEAHSTIAAAADTVLHPHFAASEST
jgi:hypothetical protein